MPLTKKINNQLLNYIKTNKLTKQQINTLINNQIDSMQMQAADLGFK
jgi:hypothetical protein